MQGRQGVESPAACIEDCIGLCTSLRKISRGRTKDVQGAAVCVIACVCGDRLHDIALCKPGYTQQFATHRPSFVRLQARRQSTVRIPLQLLMSGSSVSLDSLPDLGIFMPGVLQKRFFFPSATRHHDRARASINQWCKAYVARGSRTTQLAGSACASLLHESIPCLKRVKRSQKGFVLKESMGTRDVKACISVMFGTILKLYPLGSKTPTFRCRVNMMDRIESLMQGTTDEMIGFINTNMDLVKLCFMEYTTYMFSYNMPCERKILMSHSAMEQYEPTCINMCDSFRQEAVATGLETWDVMNASARACIERCIRICKFKMLRIADVCLKAYVDPLLFSERSLQFKCVNGDPEAMGSFHPGSSSQEQRVALSLQGNIVCRPLPDSVTALQRESLWR